MTIIDLTGQRFGKLFVFGIARKKSGVVYWDCTCDCNPEKHIERVWYQLKVSKYPSCGCGYPESKRKYNEYDLSGEYGIGHTMQGKDFYFDLEDYERIKGYNWFLKDNGYIITTIKKKSVRLNRMLMGFPEGKIVDHINRDPLDNRKLNLRITTSQGNAQNITKYKNKTSKYVGVYFSKERNRWRTKIHGLDGKPIYLGQYKNEDDAAIAYNKKAEELGYLTRNILE